VVSSRRGGTGSSSSSSSSNDDAIQSSAAYTSSFGSADSQETAADFQLYGAATTTTVIWLDLTAPGTALGLSQGKERDLIERLSKLPHRKCVLVRVPDMELFEACQVR
jgi:hypothetical protein